MCYILFKYDGRPAVLTLYSVQKCPNYCLDLSESSPILVCDVPRVAPVMANTALY